MNIKTIITSTVAFVLFLVTSISYSGMFDYFQRPENNVNKPQPAQPVKMVERVERPVVRNQGKAASLNEQTIDAIENANKANMLADQAVTTAALKAKEAADYADKLANVAMKFAINASDDANKKVKLAKIAEAKSKFVANLAKEVSRNQVDTTKFKNKNIRSSNLPPVKKSMLGNLSISKLYTKLEQSSSLADKLAQETDDANRMIVNAINETVKQAQSSYDIANTTALIARQIANKANQKAQISKKYAVQQNKNAHKIEETMDTIRKAIVNIGNESTAPTATLQGSDRRNNVQNDV